MHSSSHTLIVNLSSTLAKLASIKYFAYEYIFYLFTYYGMVSVLFFLNWVMIAGCLLCASRIMNALRSVSTKSIWRTWACFHNQIMNAMRSVWAKSVWALHECKIHTQNCNKHHSNLQNFKLVTVLLSSRFFNLNVMVLMHGDGVPATETKML